MLGNRGQGLNSRTSSRESRGPEWTCLRLNNEAFDLPMVEGCTLALPREDRTRAQKIEVFSAGCAVCQETVEMVRRIAGTSHTVEVLDMQRADVAAKAKQYGVQRVPSVAIDGQLASCCTDRAPDETTLRTAIHG
jgi:glutaredoxin 3